MKNKIVRYLLAVLMGSVVSIQYSCRDEFERELKMRSFFKVHEGNEDNIYFQNEPVQFYNYSLHATGYLWDFNDGTSTSTEKEPIHTFTEEGKYGVSLKVSNGVEEVVFTDTLTIVVEPG
ncbi:PKD domain-containing protein [Fulvivirga sp. M361]|uniref:PKD domain-containing protein n=1 Tax=Fulvivirga sp. M361 TaxID=2594266 RepID=UPI0011799125|nr:PKD domain-containing protein [Fulvivirga sp. M361]TRX60165.1 PKD domain-containing protein [Fulvivirga sp. M361]